MLCPLTFREAREPQTQTNKTGSKSNLTQECYKEKCQWWTVLREGENNVGNCAMAWLPILSIEIKQALPLKTTSTNKNLKSQKVKVKRKVGNKK